ncbi:ECF RNA polymerase sigma factor SigW [Rosistilla oblonga]|uniref:ECF RNA polymerase sigma factor SigW n=1 Tax=Rosistilla oblonga TaxID=2527990 RepID=A0A518IYX9_9BACT|nr:sigma-70 family RNA polymerase sigma factor [Rosistilla oblonga]QDV13520.1 ECF RNA polymerase sigma factor SigW [Rosistilla oblonga]QDV58288.1 ECF RNA polymerase sigma factor SigW [Rosistilla oblonga]
MNEASSNGKPLSHATLEQAVSELLPYWLRMAQRLSGDPEIAEEAVQDALVRVAKSWKGFRGQATLQTWVGRIVIHCVRDRMTARKQPTGCQEAAPDVVAKSRGPVEELLASEQQQRVRTAIGLLPDRQREVLTLTIWEAKSVAEVGELLEISTQNVYATLHVARQRLKEILREE